MLVVTVIVMKWRIWSLFQLIQMIMKWWLFLAVFLSLRDTERRSTSELDIYLVADHATLFPKCSTIVVSGNRSTHRHCPTTLHDISWQIVLVGWGTFASVYESGDDFITMRKIVSRWCPFIYRTMALGGWVLGNKCLILPFLCTSQNQAYHRTRHTISTSTLLFLRGETA